jgi:hypothetical protein
MKEVDSIKQKILLQSTTFSYIYLGDFLFYFHQNCEKSWPLLGTISKIIPSYYEPMLCFFGSFAGWISSSQIYSIRNNINFVYHFFLNHKNNSCSKVSLFSLTLFRSNNLGAFKQSDLFLQLIC